MNNNITTLASWIKESNSLVFFGGAGVSTESGIPDFRSTSGLYQANRYAYPAEYLLSHTCFTEKTDTFFDYYRNEMIHKDAKPNDSHLALAKLENMGYLQHVITQNIDGLHQMAGSRNVLELHGSVHRNACTRCHSLFSLSDVIKHETRIPTCNCGGVIKPDVVLYEEALDEVVVGKALDAIAKADVLIIGGTSLRVYPAAGFLRYFKGQHLVLINQDETSFDKQADLVFRQPIAQVMKQVMTKIEFM